MTPATAAALRCPVCQGPLLQVGRTLRCPKAHSFDLAKEGYANLLPIQKKHAADPGDGKEMVRARRAFLSAGHYAPLMQALADLCADLPHGHIVDAGCGEGSYDAYLYKALGTNLPSWASTSPKRPCAWRPGCCRRLLSVWAAAFVPPCGMAGPTCC